MWPFKQVKQVRATEPSFPVELMLYKAVFCFESVDEILSVTMKMKAIEKYFHVVLFVILYKVVLTFEYVDEIK